MTLDEALDIVKWMISPTDKEEDFPNMLERTTALRMLVHQVEWSIKHIKKLENHQCRDTYGEGDWGYG